jgi:segregation and condensation protein A
MIGSDLDADEVIEISEVEQIPQTKVVKIGQEQIHGLLFGEQLSWQAIIYDLINTEQLDPWDIDLVMLTNKYLEKVRELEEANLFISSKVLFAAALLLRIKSELLLNKYLPDLDAILFGEKEEKKYVQERIQLDEDIPELVPRTPLPRFRKVSLQELMEALGKAITTENRRIRKVVTLRQQELETAISLPKGSINIKDRIKDIYSKVRDIFSSRDERIAFSEFVEKHHDGDRVGTFVPLLHLDYQHKVLLEQEGHLQEIYVWLKSLHESKHEVELRKMKEEVEKAFAEEGFTEDNKKGGESVFAGEEEEVKKGIFESNESAFTKRSDDEE